MRPADVLPPLSPYCRLAPCSFPATARGQLCNTAIPPTALSPSSLAPDVLHLEACSTPSCAGLATNPTSSPPVLGTWKDSKEGQPNTTIGLQQRAVSFVTSE